MTFDEMTERIKAHIAIHKKKEPQAILITEALNEAVILMENQKWHYPSNDDLPKDGEFVLGYTQRGTYSVYRFVDGWFELVVIRELRASKKFIVAWRHLPEPPEEK